jgi:cobalamin biosynthesis protein CobD/CbiB
MSFVASVPDTRANGRWMKPAPKISLSAIAQALGAAFDPRRTYTGKDRQAADPIAFPGCRRSDRKLRSSLYGIVLETVT